MNVSTILCFLNRIKDLDEQEVSELSKTMFAWLAFLLNDKTDIELLYKEIKDLFYTKNFSRKFFYFVGNNGIDYCNFKDLSFSIILWACFNKPDKVWNLIKDEVDFKLLNYLKEKFTIYDKFFSLNITELIQRRLKVIDDFITSKKIICLGRLEGDTVSNLYTDYVKYIGAGDTLEEYKLELNNLRDRNFDLVINKINTDRGTTPINVRQFSYWFELKVIREEGTDNYIIENLNLDEIPEPDLRRIKIKAGDYIEVSDSSIGIDDVLMDYLIKFKV